MRCLVTGGAGFIGSHVTELLLERGHDVIVLDNLSSGRRDWVGPSAEFVQADICDADALGDASTGCDVVIHLAAMSRSAPSGGMLDECIRTNVTGVAALLAAVSANAIPRVVYAASSTYYGSGGVPNQVGNPPDFLNYYGVTKYVGEALLGVLARSGTHSVACLRLFNVYGPRQPVEGQYALVIGHFLRAVNEGRPLEVHGDGSQRRDFVHVRDVARAFVLASQAPFEGALTLNVGTGTNVSILELAKMISPAIVFGPRRSGDAKDTLADISATVDFLGWDPTVSFDEGLSELKSLPL